MSFCSLQYPPPSNWQDFESLCLDLWKSIWEDDGAQKNGRQGQSQHGVDIWGQPDGTTEWHGVQCKGKDNYTNQNLTENELLSEVEKAKGFTPQLSKFIMATTAPRDAKIQEKARQLTDAHQCLFKISIYSWADIIDLLERHRPPLALNVYPTLGNGYSFDTKSKTPKGSRIGSEIYEDYLSEHAFRKECKSIPVNFVLCNRTECKNAIINWVNDENPQMRLVRALFDDYLEGLHFIVATIAQMPNAEDKLKKLLWLEHSFDGYEDFDFGSYTTIIIPTQEDVIARYIAKKFEKIKLFLVMGREMGDTREMYQACPSLFGKQQGEIDINAPPISIIKIQEDPSVPSIDFQQCLKILKEHGLLDEGNMSELISKNLSGYKNIRAETIKRLSDGI